MRTYEARESRDGTRSSEIRLMTTGPSRVYEVQLYRIEARSRSPVLEKTRGVETLAAARRIAREWLIPVQ